MLCNCSECHQPVATRVCEYVNTLSQRKHKVPWQVLAYVYAFGMLSAAWPSLQHVRAHYLLANVLIAVTLGKQAPEAALRGGEV